MPDTTWRTTRVTADECGFTVRALERVDSGVHPTLVVRVQRGRADVPCGDYLCGASSTACFGTGLTATWREPAVEQKRFLPARLASYSA